MDTKEEREKYKERLRFMRNMGKFLEDVKPGVARKLEPSMVCMVMCAEDFDPEHNDFWREYDNKSAVRDDVHCSWCGLTVAMSNWMYPKYKEMQEKPKICCNRCFPMFISEMEASSASKPECSLAKEVDDEYRLGRNEG